MKKFVFLAIAAMAVMTGCKKDEKDEDYIDMVVVPLEGTNGIGFDVGAEKVTVDWGDNSPVETIKKNDLSSFRGWACECRHIYKQRDTFSIHVTTLDFSSFQYDLDDYRKTVEKVTLAVEHINIVSFTYQNLKELDISLCAGLNGLHIEGNLLSASALNEIIENLPEHPHSHSASLDIWGNPGSDACNKSIAEAKGWSVN